MKLYYSKGACSLAVRIIINELGVDATYESVNLKTKQTGMDADFCGINTKGSVPTLQLDNQQVLTEAAVILQYLADQYEAFQLLPQLGDFTRYRVLEWLNYLSTEVHKSFSPLFNENISQDLKDNLFIPQLKSKLTYIDKQLHNRQYLLGDMFTLPDAYLFVMLRWATHLKVDLAAFDELNRYAKTLSSRPSIQMSLKQES